MSPRTWRGVLEDYSRPRLGRSLLDLATSVVAYLVLLVGMYFALRVSVVLALLFVLPAAGFLLRTFIVFHDCTHRSFLRSKRANDLLGAALGLLVLLPFRSWQHEHAVHHATAGDLDRRGVGDITTLTVSEYTALPPLSRLRYRLFRNPIVMFGLGWVLVLGLKPRWVPAGAARSVRNSILTTDAVLAIVIAFLCVTLGWRTFLLLQLPVWAVTGATGIWFFYVQHQFEGAYWRTHDAWRYDQAALEGSSYLKLPAVLQFFTGNIGFHHVHHLSVAVPNYNLPSAHEATQRHYPVPQLTIRDGLRATRLKLWDERQGALVSFRAARTERASLPAVLSE
jgi:acyl-lipid omega-6 desaturase (Delta-12 desaturase)